jgi:Ssu72-like protein
MTKSLNVCEAVPFLVAKFHSQFLFLGLENKENESNAPVHVINIDIQDNHEEATIGAFMICELIDMVNLSYLAHGVVSIIQFYIPDE